MASLTITRMLIHSPIHEPHNLLALSTISLTDSLSHSLVRSLMISTGPMHDDVPCFPLPQLLEGISSLLADAIVANAIVAAQDMCTGRDSEVLEDWTLVSLSSTDKDVLTKACSSASPELIALAVRAVGHFDPESDPFLHLQHPSARALALAFHVLSLLHPYESYPSHLPL